MSPHQSQKKIEGFIKYERQNQEVFEFVNQSFEKGYGIDYKLYFNKHHSSFFFFNFSK